ncbi:MAG: (Fe-S)-binding protein [Candidatus Hodarchaeota archaeon]
MANYVDQIHRCFRCGFCKMSKNFVDYNCPSYNRFRFESYSTGGRLWLIEAWRSKKIEWSEYLAEIVFSCVNCRNCVEQCPMRFNTDILDWINAARSDIIEQGLSPRHVNEFLQNIYRYGNPWGLPRDSRGNWMEKVKGIEYYTNEKEYLYYIGCVGSYDQRGQNMAINYANLLNKAYISFGILGVEEDCDGNEVSILGETELFRELATKNVEKFNTLGVRKIITLSPHAYNTMKNKYRKLNKIEILHYTQVLEKMIEEDKLGPLHFNTNVTYHDPCFLGRYNAIYETPRIIIQSISGITLIEMDRNKENAFCCGGGSGNFVFDLLGNSEESPSRTRVREAHKLGVEHLIVACPSCLIMFDEAIKAENLEDKLTVIDLAELVKKSLR